MMKFPSPLLRAMIVTGLTVGLVACSGGGGTGGSTPIAMAPPPPPPPPPPTSSDPTWTPGQFAPSSDFEARCENPRTGVDSEGNAFPDTQGSTTIENFWLRSWSNETYLFNTEITDRNPASFSDRLAYFDVLRTTATTASGEDKDEPNFSKAEIQHPDQATEPELQPLAKAYRVTSVSYIPNLILRRVPVSMD